MGDSLLSMSTRKAGFVVCKTTPLLLAGESTHALTSVVKSTETNDKEFGATKVFCVVPIVGLETKVRLPSFQGEVTCATDTMPVPLRPLTKNLNMA